MDMRRIINRAIIDNAHGRGPNVYYIGYATKNPARVYDVRYRDCALQVRFLETGVWVQLEYGDTVVTRPGDGVLYTEKHPQYVSK